MVSDKTLSKNWNNFWTTKYRSTDVEMQPDINSHQCKLTRNLLKRYQKGDKILEAGCGLGNWVFIFEEMGFVSVGIDLSLASLEIANKYVLKNNLKSNFLLADVRKIPIKDNYFDAVVSYGVIEHFINSENALMEFQRVLKSGGACLITTPNPFSFHRLIGRHILNITKSRKLGYVGYEKAFTPKQLASLLTKAGFTKIEFGILSEGMGNLFGVFWPGLPVIGKAIHKFLTKVAFYIERKQNIVGGGSYAIGYKILI